MDLEQSIKGAIYGIQIGDALGAAVECLSKNGIRKRYGKVEDYKSGIWGIPYFLKTKGSGTDDTRLSFAVLRGLLKDNPETGLTKEFNKERVKFLHIGRTLFYAYLLHGTNWKCTAKRVHSILKGKTAGNGALMRTLPVALLYDSWDDIVTLTTLQAEMTHLHPISTQSCLIYNRVAFLIMNQVSIRDAIMEATKRTDYENTFLQTPKLPPNGYAFHTLIWVLYWLYHSETFEEAVIGAVNEGGDADTIASLVGGIAGLYYGFNSIPGRFLSLKSRERLDAYTLKICLARSSRHQR
ncbi:ADP-ribosylglycohydrolase family protein [Paenibacillus polymyxa]|uniref:ADP-ribosyl-[dinitrogen reductase] hydrolase n=1 Tax=Paenibacillus polymyxa (strain SC2) TaxID=886882 RepID=E3EL52_PAEPS|nr:ADP-ribosylglycohydrolase family protein [Paenibacillus polymyxa]ADO59614.1 hypothetical protein PPSC2_27075 [Paenibacillus polymyxa SC2]WPQ59563.1 ADP-ribosylglycohydrolase family protein [Paenibacillus polymyxa]